MIFLDTQRTYTDSRESTPPARIIPRAEHTVSRADIDVEVLKVLYRLHHQGYQAYLVGGSVRDLLLGRKPKDFDVATDAHPGEVRRIFRNSRIIGKRFRLVQVFFRGGKIVEVSTFRRRSEFEDENDILQPNNTFGSPAEDALRRDLTINALFYNVADFTVIDYIGGLEDLHQGLIRVIGPPTVRFRRDPVRMLRVIRHAARTRFAIDPEAWESIRQNHDAIRMCAPSRVRDELLKDFKGGAAGAFFPLMHDCGLLEAIFPGFASHLARPEAARRCRQRWAELFGRVDELVQAGQPLSEAFFWTVLLTPFWEAGETADASPAPRPADLEGGRHLLEVLELPRRRLDEIQLLLATTASLAFYEGNNRRLPLKIQRRACFPEATWLYALKNNLPVPAVREGGRPSRVSDGDQPAPRRKKRRRRKRRSSPRQADS